MATNKKTILAPQTMAKAGLDLLRARGDIEVVPFPPAVAPPEFLALIKSRNEINGAILGGTGFGKAETAASKGLQVVARIGVGYDAVDVPALTARGVPLMTTGIANSPSVAEQAMFMMLALAKRGAELNTMVQENRWNDRFGTLPFDLLGKTVTVVGFGRIGSRTAKRCNAMEMKVLVYDPYVKAEAVKAAGCEPTKDLDAALAKSDFVTIHCPKTPETTGMFDAARIGRLKPTAYLVNTARGGIVDEPALHKALTTGKLAGAGLDVYAKEPPEPDNPLLKLANVISAPHMAGVTVESVDRMAIEAAKNVLSVLDGRVNKDNVINKEVLG
jgi:D-3-phosphoglycerate dehydrogenase